MSTEFTVVTVTDQCELTTMVPIKSSHERPHIDMIKSTLEQKMAKAIKANPGFSDQRIAKNCRTKTPVVAMFRKKMGFHPTANTNKASESPESAKTTEPSPPAGGGIALGRCRVLSRKPSESAGKFIKRLPTGRGFDLKSLAKEWGMSEDTIKRHAKDLGCFKFVEVSEDEWVPLVMNPETANKYNS